MNVGTNDANQNLVCVSFHFLLPNVLKRYLWSVRSLEPAIEWKDYLSIFGPPMACLRRLLLSLPCFAETMPKQRTTASRLTSNTSKPISIPSYHTAYFVDSLQWTVLTTPFRLLVARLKGNGKPIEYIDIDIPLNELTDGIHPK